MNTQPASTVLVLRTCGPDMKSEAESAKGFQWPESGPVACNDWDPKPACGNGLHGLLWAQGDFGQLSRRHDAKFLVVEVEASAIVSLEDGQKVKFPRGNVIMCTTKWWEAIAFIKARAPKPEKLEASSDARRGHASATGDSGHASATGNYGHASATGNYGHASATGYSGHASATGNYGHASATGDSGRASATGDSGRASATGNYGHASATGNYGHACVLNVNGGRAKAKENGLVAVAWWDEAAKRGRLAVGYVGEDGIKADTWYGVRDGKLAEMPATV